MKYPTHAVLISVLLVGAYAGGVRAASLSHVDHQGSVGYSAMTGGMSSNDAGVDLSAPPSQLSLFGAKGYSSPVHGGTLAHAYAADAYLDYAGGGADLFMSLSHSLVAESTGVFSATHQQDLFVDLSSVTMRIDGTGGEAAGTAVRVSFAGLASAALYDFGSAAQGGYLGLGLSVVQGDTVMGEYLWDVQASGEQAVSFGFTGYVGQTYTLSAFMLSGVGVDGTGLVAGADGMLRIAEVGASLGGNFAVTPVPEPETVAMLLAGLGVLAAAVRRRQRV